MAAEFDEHAVTIGAEGLHRASELDHLTQVAAPVARIERGSVETLSRHRRIERDRARPRSKLGQRFPERFQDTVHVRAVGGKADVHPAASHAVGAERAFQIRQRVQIAGHHARIRRIEDADGQPVLPRHQPRSHLCLRQRNREHAATLRNPRNQPAAQRYQARTVFEAQRPALNCRRDLTLAVADHCIRSHPETAPHRRQPDRHRKQHRLHHVDPIERRHLLAVVPSQHGAHRPAGMGQQRSVASRDRIREHRRLRKQRTAHPKPLAAVAREHEHHPAEQPCRPGRHRRMGPPLRQRLERVLRLPDIVGLDRSTRIEVRPVDRRRANHRRKIRLRMRPKPLRPSPRLRTKRRFVPARHHKRYRAKRLRLGADRLARHQRRRLRRDRHLARRFLDDDVRVGARDAEAAHPRPAQLCPASRAQPRGSCNSARPLPCHATCGLGSST